MSAKLLATITLAACVTVCSTVGCRSNAARRRDAASSPKQSYASRLLTSLVSQQFKKDRKPYEGPRKWHWDDEAQKELTESMSDRERERDRAKQQVDNRAALDRDLSNLELR